MFNKNKFKQNKILSGTKSSLILAFFYVYIIQSLSLFWKENRYNNKLTNLVFIHKK